MRFPYSYLMLTASMIPGLAQSQASTERQRALVAAQEQASKAMEAGLAAQRASIARQIRETNSDSYFLLPPPRGSGLSGAPAAFCDPLPRSTLDPLIAEAAAQQGLPAELLSAVARTESGFRPCAVSPKGALGLMQLMPETASRLGVENPFDPKENMDAGARLLKGLLTVYGDLPLALGAYNAGPSLVNEAGGLPNIPETLNYVQKVMGLLVPGARK